MSKFIQQNGKQSRNIQAEKINVNNEKAKLNDTNSNFSERIKNHPVIVYSSIAIIAFISGFAAKTGIEVAANQELVTKDTYVLNNVLDANYIKKSDYELLNNENEKLIQKEKSDKADLYQLIEERIEIENLIFTTSSSKGLLDDEFKNKLQRNSQNIKMKLIE